ncbi:Hydroxyacylglutathione hydrolase [Frondihabitans sp. 762G35]|uniref:MBL fold metallo-hydrolase n=1 Tax=Frondihabitans sp. 762G35 TaxID=1446794 RepID=UPI000D225917|nr:Hydroxyacylglutathione hydrolase [Frondihabitans sp. 762G35]
MRAAAGSDRVLLVDPAWEVDELESLADALDERSLRPVAGFSTHAHHDHLLWHPRFGDVPRWSSAETARLAAGERAALLTMLGPWPDDLVPLVGAVTAVDGDLIPWAGQEARLVVHDAHVPGHTAVWLPGPRILLAGDLLSDVELPLPDEPPGALERYALGLDALAPFVARARLVVPGHGSPGTDARARLDRDRRYLDAVSRGLEPDDERLADEAMRLTHAETVRLHGRGAGRTPASDD